MLDGTDHRRQVSFPEKFHEFQTMLQAERHTKRTSEVRFKKRGLPSNGPFGPKRSYADMLRRVIPYAWLTDPAFAGSVSPYPPTANR